MGLGLRSATIVGMGAYIPEDVRTNEFWTDEVVEKWNKTKGDKTTFLHLNKAVDYKEKMHSFLEEELNHLIGDPFVGMKERRVSKLTPSEMEKKACLEALEDARINSKEVELVMGFSLPADRVYPPNIHKVHYELGLKNARCFEVNAICHSFLTMLDIAYQYIRNGTIKNALIFVSTKYSSIMDYSSSVSVAAGDGAVAVVVKQCDEKIGLQFSYQGFETEFHDAMCIRRRPPLRQPTSLFDFGDMQSSEKVFFTILNSQKGRELISRIPFWAEKTKEAFLQVQEEMCFDKIDILVTNAAFVWYSRVVAKIFDIPIEKVEDNILKFSNMGAVNLPMNLYTAYKNERLKDGNNVLLFGHGGGASFGGALLKWFKNV